LEQERKKGIHMLNDAYVSTQLRRLALERNKSQTQALFLETMSRPAGRRSNRGMPRGSWQLEAGVLHWRWDWVGRHDLDEGTITEAA
jgi:hypothetical protein